MITFKAFYRLANPLRWAFCVSAVALFTWNVAFFYLPGQGFTFLIQFGQKMHGIYLPELRSVNHYEIPNSVGYDSQYYAEIALRPDPRDPVLKKAVDGLSYRARRILFPAVAWILGNGSPSRILNIFALENIVCWYLLAGLLIKWLPPVNWGNCLRWAAVLFSFGLTFSVARSLLDGPSLVLIAAAMVLVESDRPWLAAVVFGIAAFGKETNLLAATAMKRQETRDNRNRRTWFAEVAIVLVPLFVWIGLLSTWAGNDKVLGDVRNFAPPFVALAEKIQESLSRLLAEGFSSVAKFDLLAVVGLIAQFFFLVLRPRLREPWWRLGATYAVLMVFLGNAVWATYPTAAARVLLPMTLAFNILVPRKGWWTLLLLVGNLGIFASADIMKPPARESFVVKGQSLLRTNPKDERVVQAIYGSANWWPVEKSRWEFWRWTSGDATIAVQNPHQFALVVDLRFRLRSDDEREGIVLLGDRVLWNGMLPPRKAIEVEIQEVDLPPGDTILTFKSDRPAVYPGHNDPRKLSFSVRDFEIDIERMK